MMIFSTEQIYTPTGCAQNCYVLWYLPYSTIMQWGKILASLANPLPFANILPIDIFHLMYTET